MPRAPLHRAAALLLALWFAAIVGDPALLHQCPMHGGTPGSHAAGAGGAHGASHGAHAADAGAPADEAPPAGHQCSCLGDCSGPTVVALSASTPMAWLAGVVDIEPSLDAPARDLPVAADYLTPFANGPPAAAAA
jgi:hypothetical protein